MGCKHGCQYWAGRLDTKLDVGHHALCENYDLDGTVIEIVGNLLDALVNQFDTIEQLDRETIDAVNAAHDLIKRDYRLRLKHKGEL